MKIKIELLGVLADATPVCGPLELPDQTTVQQLLERLGLAPRAGLSVSINNRIVRDRQHVLHDGDCVMLVPPAMGG